MNDELLGTNAMDGRKLLPLMLSSGPQHELTCVTEGKFRYFCQASVETPIQANHSNRPTEEEVDALGPEFRKAWDRDFKNVPDRPLMIMALYNW